MVYIIKTNMETTKKQNILCEYSNYCKDNNGNIYFICDYCGLIMEHDEIRECTFMKNLYRVQCDECLTIFIGIGDDICPQCEGKLHEIINTSQTMHSTSETMQNSDWREELKNLKCINGAMYFGSVEDPCDCGAPKCENQQTYENALAELINFISSTIQSEVDKAVKERGKKIVEHFQQRRSIDIAEIMDYLNLN